MSGADFLFLYEHVAREYESLLLLKTELQKRGHSVEIRQLLDRKKLSLFTTRKPKVIVTSNLYDNEGLNSHVFNNVGRLDKVVNLHWEQILSDTQEEEPWFNFAGNAKKCVHLCWGEKTRRRLIAHGMPPQNCPVTGAVMMDFLRPEFAGYYADRGALCRQHGIDEKQEIFLYISSFGYAGMGEAEVRELSKMAGQDFAPFAEVNRRSLTVTLSWLRRYLDENRGATVIYRPHPSEWKSPLLSELEKEQPRFRVIGDGPVKQWILAADRIGLWMSTAAAEVYFAGKNCVVLRPYSIPHEFDPVIYKGGRYAESYEAFYEQLKNPALPFPLSKAEIEGYFDVSAAPAYRRTADLLEQVLRQPPRDKPFSLGYKPRFNALKYFALLGIHGMNAVHLNPARFQKVAPKFAAFAGRIWGYIQKAKISPAQAAAMEAHIRKFVMR